MLGVGEKQKNKNKNKKNEKSLRLVALPSPFYDIAVDCFPVSDNAENKPDLP